MAVAWASCSFSPGRCRYLLCCAAWALTLATSLFPCSRLPAWAGLPLATSTTSLWLSECSQLSGNSRLTFRPGGREASVSHTHAHTHVHTPPRTHARTHTPARCRTPPHRICTQRWGPGPGCRDEGGCGPSQGAGVGPQHWLRSSWQGRWWHTRVLMAVAASRASAPLPFSQTPVYHPSGLPHVGLSPRQDSLA